MSAFTTVNCADITRDETNISQNNFPFDWRLTPDLRWHGPHAGPATDDVTWSVAANQRPGLGVISQSGPGLHVVMMWWPSVVTSLTQTRPRVTTGECTPVSPAPGSPASDVTWSVSANQRPEPRVSDQWEASIMLGHVMSLILRIGTTKVVSVPNNIRMKLMVSSAHTDVTMTWPPQVPSLLVSV